MIAIRNRVLYALETSVDTNTPWTPPTATHGFAVVCSLHLRNPDRHPAFHLDRHLQRSAAPEDLRALAGIASPDGCSDDLPERPATTDRPHPAVGLSDERERDAVEVRARGRRQHAVDEEIGNPLDELDSTLRFAVCRLLRGKRHECEIVLGPPAAGRRRFAGDEVCRVERGLQAQGRKAAMSGTKSVCVETVVRTLRRKQALGGLERRRVVAVGTFARVERGCRCAQIAPEALAHDAPPRGLGIGRSIVVDGSGRTHGAQLAAGELPQQLFEVARHEEVEVAVGAALLRPLSIRAPARSRVQEDARQRGEPIRDDGHSSGVSVATQSF